MSKTPSHRARPWTDLFERLPESVRAEVSAKADRTVAAIRLAELRRALGQTQHDVAAALNVDQSEVSRLERRRDLHVGTLSRYAAALGGRLELRISFPDGTTVEIADTSDDAA
jgi:DNA-binding XRE family transcriptional regulator